MLEMRRVDVPRHRRFFGSWLVHIEKPDGTRAPRTFICGTDIFDDVALVTAQIAEPPATCLWCVAGRDKW
jgi:hypothetical protein